ncbi:hypothetical protein RND71_003424 [Anisodus tanguticus]|uniref:PHD finger protein ALFIN-LIKE n=1 Tax=Anisodus tanguticus TaxID=243964 RepID=A0AAE1ST94_9SOLA|nr:hypothetical protein RND71_003424 [Anisodus tanguticus]
MEGIPHPIPRTVEEVFNDFKGRRAALIKALTTDVEKFYQQCDPEKENLCLYGLPNETWEVNLPVEEVPPELPEPALGINFARDGMQEKDWLSLVAVHSDSWLLSVAFYFGARFGFGKSERYVCLLPVPKNRSVYLLQKTTANVVPTGHYVRYRIVEPRTVNSLVARYQWEVHAPMPTKLHLALCAILVSVAVSFVPLFLHLDHELPSVSTPKGDTENFGEIMHGYRKRLFQMINDLPTVFEVVTGAAKQARDADHNNSSKSKSSGKFRQSEPQHKGVKMSPPKEEDESGEEVEEEDEQGATLCGACGDNYGQDEFWICCDVCEKWFHGKCVKITPAKAEHIKQYKCPSCSNKRARV